jgi:hypothetical protein
MADLPVPGAAEIKVSCPFRMKTSLRLRASKGEYRGVPPPLFLRRPWLRERIGSPFRGYKVDTIWTISDQ